MNKRTLKVVNNDGREIEYEVLLAFTLRKTGKNYVVYTDNTVDDNGNLNVFASIYFKEDGSRLEQIETEEEWNEIEKRLKKIQNKI